MKDLQQKFVIKLSCTSFARRKHLNGFHRRKNFTVKACAEFYCRQIAEKFSLKFPLCITNLERLIQTSMLFFLVRLRVPSAFVQPAQFLLA